MSAPIGAALILVAFAAATLTADALPRRVHWIPLAALGVLLFALFMELGRYDHGHAGLLYAVGWIGAPLAVIFGGAAWGTRRFYGWPDLGAHPSRAAAMAICILLGVMAGTKMQAEDIRISEQRAEALLRDTGSVFDWDGAYIRSVGESRMGWFDPPLFWTGRDRDQRRILAFHLSRDAWRMIDYETRTWRTSLEDPTR